MFESVHFRVPVKDEAGSLVRMQLHNLIHEAEVDTHTTKGSRKVGFEARTSGVRDCKASACCYVMSRQRTHWYSVPVTDFCKLGNLLCRLGIRDRHWQLIDIDR